MPQSSLMTWFKKSIATTQSSSASEGRNNNAETAKDQQQPDQATLVPAPTAESVDSSNVPVQIDQPSLGSNVKLRACTKQDIPHLKRLTSLLLPIPYPEKFFREIIEDELTNKITLLAFWHETSTAATSGKGRLVGAIRCRLFAHPSVETGGKTGPMLYLSTLVLLSPYRGHGIAAMMLDTLVRRAVRDYGITSVGAHVWAANDEALAWYRKRGFKAVGTEARYYPRLDPPEAIIMQKHVGVFDLATARTPKP